MAIRVVLRATRLEGELLAGVYRTFNRWLSIASKFSAVQSMQSTRYNHAQGSRTHGNLDTHQRNQIEQ